VDAHPLFLASGERLIYQRFFPERRRGDIYWRPAAGGDEQPLLENPPNQGSIPTGVSADGRWLLFKVAAGLSQTFTWDIWVLPLTDADAQAQPIVTTPFDERDAQFSPDGNWILYQSNESGQFEVYVQPFGRAGERQLVSAAGGAQPRWRADGQEIFYVSLDGRLTSVAVEQSSTDGGALLLGRPQGLFLTNSGPVVPDIDRQSYLPSADGQQFLMRVVPTGTAAPLNVILNFDPAKHR
jgi:Tol biopolymer transport system component